MSFVADLEPKQLWSHFDRILEIPRGSRNEAKIREYVISVAEKNGLTHKVDDLGNLVVQKPGTAGKEQSPATVLQGHLDMVNDKNSDVDFDFDKDAIKPFREEAPVGRVARAAWGRVIRLLGLLVVRHEREEGIVGIAVRIVVARRQHDRVGVSPSRDLVEVGEHVVAHDAPALARLDEGAGIVCPRAHGLPSAHERAPHVRHVRLVDKQVIGVDVRVAQRTRGQARALHRDPAVLRRAI